MTGTNNAGIMNESELSSHVFENECEELNRILHGYVESYIDNKSQPIEEWLFRMMNESFPEKSKSEINEIVSDIIISVGVSEEKKDDLYGYLKNGKNRENWIDNEIKKATSSMSAEGVSKYMNVLQNSVNEANESLYRTLITQSGQVNMNPSLDGFIAEKYHAETFNMNAKATGSEYRAKVLEPKPGESYGKNSVDIVIVDGNGKIVRKYQSKYGKDSAATRRAFEHGDYDFQRKLVPEGQEKDIPNSTCVLEAPDGTKSNPLSKKRAQEMKKEAQSGNWNDLNWNEYKSKDIAIGLGKQVGLAALQGAVIGAGTEVAKKLWNGEKIESSDLAKKMLISGADFGLKAAVTGAIKVAAEKNIIKVIPKGVPTTTIANIVFVAIEDLKITEKMITKQVGFREGIELLELTTITATVGLMAAGKGAAIGAYIGSVLGPVGTAIGGFIGGTIGYMIGSGVTSNVFNEVLGKGAYGSIFNSSAQVYNASRNMLDYYDSIHYNMDMFEKNLVRMKVKKHAIEKNIEKFDRIKGEML